LNWRKNSVCDDLAVEIARWGKVIADVGVKPE
jgi:hypothetical protein